MKKYFIVSLLSLSAINIAVAQEYKVDKTISKMTLNLSSVTVEGYNGNQIIFRSTKEESEMDPRAKGLRVINGSGYTDNTGLGISVKDNGSTLEVNQVAYTDLAIKIMVPKNVILSLVCRSMVNAGTIRFVNLENEIEISTDYNKIELENITGPATVRALYGSVDATFNGHIKGPISIASIYSTVDVAIPVDTKANVKLSSSHGELLAASELKIEIEKNSEDDMVRYGSTVNGKLNGGGAEFKLVSEYGKVYLRKTK
jgi:hypothetical protein